jgi:hypothetical protein
MTDSQVDEQDPKPHGLGTQRNPLLSPYLQLASSE